MNIFGVDSLPQLSANDDETPDPGPEEDTVYVPGSSGGSWTEEEVASTRLRVLQMIHPDWDVKKDMLSKSLKVLRNEVFNGVETCFSIFISLGTSD